MRKAKWTKRIFALAMCVVMAAFSVPTYAKEAETPADALRGEADEDGFVIEDEVLLKYTGDASEVSIPPSVTLIAPEAFKNCSSLTKVTIPGHVSIGPGGVSIGQEAFAGCTHLSEVTLYDVGYIGTGAFHDCSSLEEITIFDVYSIGSGAFCDCSHLTNVVLPEGLERIGIHAFADCGSLSDLTIPSSVTMIGEGAFLGTAWLKNKRSENPLVVINGILVDGYACSGAITIPDNVTSIGSMVFWDCSDTIYVDGGSYQFKYDDGYEASGLTSVVIPSSVLSIGNQAFDGCTYLKEVDIKDGLASIGQYAFGWCLNLKRVVIPPSVTEIGEHAFNGCEYVTIYGEEGSYAQKYAEENNIPFNRPAIKTAQTISGTKTYNKTYGDKAFSLDAKRTVGDGELTYVSSNTKVATVDSKGKVTIKGTGAATITVKAAATADYKAASVNVTVKVSPAKQAVKSLKTVKGKKLTVSWKKDAQATGYQIQYSTKKNFSGAKTKTVTSYKTTSKTLTGLSKGKKYYVRVRAYKTAKVNGKSTKLYGAWSGAKRSGSIPK